MKIRFQPHPALAASASPRTAILALATLAFFLSACDRQDKASAAVAPVAVAPVAVAPAAPVAPSQAALARLNAPAAPLSAVAEVGRKIFNDKSLSASGKLSCASCHNPDNAHAPANGLAVQLGGMHLQAQGGRAVPSLRYHEHAPAFSIGPDTKPDEDDKGAVLQAAEAKTNAASPAQAVAKATLQPGAAVQEVVPQGGFDWDGRATNLTDQAGGPLLAANEMANKSAAQLLAKLKAASYAKDMLQLFGPAVFTSPNLALGEAYYALALYQKEDRSFHPYDSKYDYYLAEQVQLSEQEMRGLKLFKDPKKGNCATCHIEKTSRDGRFPPVFTDYQFEALAAPRNKAILANRDPKYFDLGMCGPWRKDAAQQLNYCGYFKTPTLRNAATRQVYFHNGVFHSLEEVVHFYVERETKPEKWYSRGKDGKLNKYDDLPAAYHANVDVTDAPFDSKAGAPPALTDDEIKDVVVFLKTLNDGYRPDGKQIAGK
ncbi:cytochrome c peroxidase [Collimonas sp. PA-H2]|uniref:cytochrome-c peroxidase n=1 Tax=Collimonas sp. PA-H2 TaxID=1881062 RepID=UPI000BF59B9D|nr:cytochrome c peroxidase [Collimonas sp. PA-H2]